MSAAYRGRFAPSPSGPLHFGSLVTALGSYLDARIQQGTWLVRMEDLDQTREMQGAADDILRTLDNFGFQWDGAIIYQSRRTEAYQAALERLLQEDLAYVCGCTRKEIKAAAREGTDAVIYPGTCSRGLPAGRTGRAIRLRSLNRKINHLDQVLGPLEQALARDVGDFVIRRADGYHAYQLAVVVDDAWQGINQIVRGADLWFSTPRQIHLQSLLGLPHPGYAHLPLVVDTTGRKLSKQQGDAPVDRRDPLSALLRALAHLDQPLPPERPASLDDFWQWAIDNWSLARVPPLTMKALSPTC
jgi:glutamyl-Q tRNA(Asp) synthetase